MESLFAWVDKFISLFSGEDLLEYQTALNGLFENLIRLGNTHEELVMFMVQSRIPMQRVARRLLALQETMSTPMDHRDLARLMIFILDNNYHYWLEEDDPVVWFHAECRDLCHDISTLELFDTVSHGALIEHRSTLADIDLAADENNGLNRLMGLPAHVDIVKVYKEISTCLTPRQPDVSKNEDSPSNIQGVLDSNMALENQKLLFYLE